MEITVFKVSLLSIHCLFYWSLEIKTVFKSIGNPFHSNRSWMAERELNVIRLSCHSCNNVTMWAVGCGVSAAANGWIAVLGMSDSAVAHCCPNSNKVLIKKVSSSSHLLSTTSNCKICVALGLVGIGRAVGGFLKKRERRRIDIDRGVAWIPLPTVLPCSSVMNA